MDRTSYPARRAYTLIELLIVVAIVGLMASLILPAVMDIRTAARRATCTNNLRQVGLGLQEFETSNGRFPGVYWGSTGTASKGNKQYWSFSPSSLIAAAIDSQSLAARVPLEQLPDAPDPDWLTLDLPAPAVLHCPADRLATNLSSSYRYCRGNLPLWPEDPGGVFVRNDQGFRAAEITDGLSETAFASERLVSIPSFGHPDRRRDLIVFDAPGTSEIASPCLEANAIGAPVAWSSEPCGNSWLSGRWLHASYYHLFPPNSAWSDCRKSDELAMAVLTARSHHPGGVNLLFGDGHVRFVSDSVNLMVWRAWATRAGFETGTGE